MIVDQFSYWNVKKKNFDSPIPLNSLEESNNYFIKLKHQSIIIAKAFDYGIRIKFDKILKGRI